MKTIYYQFSENHLATEMSVVAETEYSYVVRFDGSEIELCATKTKEGKQWFWTKEEADAAYAAHVEFQAIINDLKRQRELA